jgi:hypothetical protein
MHTRLGRAFGSKNLLFKDTAAMLPAADALLTADDEEDDEAALVAATVDGRGTAEGARPWQNTQIHGDGQEDR